MKCFKCSKDYEKLIETLNKASSGMYQIRGECPNCLQWVKWVPYRDSHIIKQVLDAFYNLDHNEILKLNKLFIKDEVRNEDNRHSF